MKFEFGGVFIQRRGKILLVQERHMGAKDRWSLPLGFVEKGETVKEGAIREAKEESGYDVRLVKKAGSILVPAKEFRSAHPFLRGKVRLTVFSAKALSKRPQRSYLKKGWFSKQQIKKLKLRGDWEKKFLY